MLLEMQGGHMSMNQQVASFGDVALEIRRHFRGDNATLSSYLSRCIFYFGIGSNDYLNNYFMPDFYTTSSDFTPRAYAATLLKDYTNQLTVICCLFNIYSGHLS